MKTILNRIRSLASSVSKYPSDQEADPIFSLRHETASVTNYEKLYAQNYYAHQSDSTSYDVERFPRLLRQLADELGVDSLLDIGGGNGKLSQIWRNGGGKAASLDYYDNPEAFCKSSIYLEMKAVKHPKFLLSFRDHLKILDFHLPRCGRTH